MSRRDQVKNMRKRLGLTQEKLCELSGVAQQTISRIESGEYDRGPQDSTIKALLDAMTEYAMGKPPQNSFENRQDSAHTEPSHIASHAEGQSQTAKSAGKVGEMDRQVLAELAFQGAGEQVAIAIHYRQEWERCRIELANAHAEIDRLKRRAAPKSTNEEKS